MRYVKERYALGIAFFYLNSTGEKSIQPEVFLQYRMKNPAERPVFSLAGIGYL
jgi:hypothetical protein